MYKTGITVCTFKKCNNKLNIREGVANKYSVRLHFCIPGDKLGHSNLACAGMGRIGSRLKELQNVHAGWLQLP